MHIHYSIRKGQQFDKILFTVTQIETAISEDALLHLCYAKNRQPQPQNYLIIVPSATQYSLLIL